MNELRFFNRQTTRAISMPLLRRVTAHFLQQVASAKGYELGIHLVAATEMARINEQYLQHEGSTDVITFSYREVSNADCQSAVSPTGSRQADKKSSTRRLSAGDTAECHSALPIAGEIFICVDDAIEQAKEFRTTWQSEVVRYIVHGVLHLLGYDDLKPDLRRVMKREENRFVNSLSREFDLGKLQRDGRQRK